MISRSHRHVLSGLGLLLAVSVSVWAAEPMPKSVVVQLDPAVQNTVLVTIDTSNLGKNIYFEGVELVLGMYDAGGQFIGEQVLRVGQQTPAGWTYITGGHQFLRYASTYQPLDSRVVWIRADRLRWANRGAMGGKAEGEPPWVAMPLNSGFIQVAPTPR